MNEANNPYLAMYDRAAYKQPPRKKSVGLAVLLALLFGPLGMFYSSTAGAFLMICVNILLYASGVTMGFFIAGPVFAMWAAIAASSHNERVRLATESGAA